MGSFTKTLCKNQPGLHTEKLLSFREMKTDACLKC